MAATSQTPSFDIAPDAAIVVAGELDVSTATPCGKAAVWIVERRHEVVLDIAELSFIDSAR